MAASKGLFYFVDSQLSKLSKPIIFFSIFAAITATVTLIVTQFISLHIFSNTLIAIKFQIAIISLVELSGFCLLGIYRSNTTKIKYFSIFKCIALLISGAAFFHIVAVVYGAPILQNVVETSHFAILLTSMTFLPCCCILGPNIDIWLWVFAARSAETVLEIRVQVVTVCSILGSWFGAFPIPLDWDRPWQVWPISCCIGALVGYVIGQLYTCYRIFTLKKSNKYKPF